MNVLITGGASGIGAAIVARLAADPDNRVHFTYCASADAAAALVTANDNVRAIRCDFRDRASVNDLVGALDGMSLNALVNNAMPGLQLSHFHKVPLEHFEDSFRETVLPVVAITQRAIALFRKSRQGRIVTVLTSSLINTPPLGLSEYVANKAYLASLSKSWAVENAQFGIAANCVSPSMVRTGLLDSFDREAATRAEEANPLRRLLTADEVAGTVEFLLKSSPHINGANVIMNAAHDVV